MYGVEGMNGLFFARLVRAEGTSEPLRLPWGIWRARAAFKRPPGNSVRGYRGSSVTCEARIRPRRDARGKTVNGKTLWEKTGKNPDNAVGGNRVAPKSR